VISVSRECVYRYRWCPACRQAARNYQRRRSRDKEFINDEVSDVEYVASSESEAQETDMEVIAPSVVSVPKTDCEVFVIKLLGGLAIMALKLLAAVFVVV